jgi:hypothetical protein
MPQRIILAEVKPYDFQDKISFETNIDEKSLKHEIDIFEQTVYTKSKYLFPTYAKQLILYLRLKFPMCTITKEKIDPV